jgi:ectoine hydroxylase-related dioxygenase (phytanoyl-CoA dioxygenase family)
MLTEEQVAEYRREGFITLPGIFTEAELAPVDRYLQENQDVAWTHKNDDPLREAHYHYRPIFDICTSPRLLDLVEPLLGGDLVLLYSHIMSKKPGGRRVAWHQDGPYWHRVEPKVAVTAWIALDDATPENGCMEVLPGGHRLGSLPHVHVTDDYVVDPGCYDMREAVQAPVRAGGGLFFHSLIPHYTAPNRSDRWRRAIALSYMSARSRFTGDGPGPEYFPVQGRTFPGCVR